MADETKAGTASAAENNAEVGGTPTETAQTNGQVPATGDAETGKEAGENVSSASFEDAEDAENGAESAADKGGKPKGQDKQKNAEFARKRREAERARELKETREKAIIDALGGKNPYTSKPMKDSADVEEFLLMQEIENKGGDPVTDFPEHQKARTREQQEKERTAREEREWFENDRTAFTEKYPKVDLDALIADEGFADYADGKVGVKPLAEIYEGYLRSAARFEERARTRAAQAAANREASPGSLGTAGSSDTGYYTPEQVDAMSKEEVKKNLDKINESMKHWK